MHTHVPDFFILVLDDFHYVEEADAVRNLLDRFIEYAPDNCHIIISSRTPVNLPSIRRLSLQGKVSTIDAKQLAFTAAEVKELLSTHFEIHLSGTEAEELTAGTEGWILGVLLGARSFLYDRTDSGLPEITRSDLYRYLASEVYERQNAELGRFLLDSSTLDEIEPGICNRLRGKANSARLLRTAVERNLFLQCIDSEGSLYRYHSLFRDFLQAKFLEENPRRFTFLHERAASLYESDGRYKDAVSHYLIANSYNKIVGLIRNIGEEYLKSGRWEVISKWLSSVPSKYWRDDSELVLLWAWSQIHLGEAAEAARNLNRVISRASKSEDWLIRAKALSWRSATHRLSGNLYEAQRDIKNAIRILTDNDGPADVLGEAYRRLGEVCKEQGRFKQAARCFKRSLRLYSKCFDLDRIAEIHNSLGVVYGLLGDMSKAGSHFDNASQSWQKVKNYGAEAMALNNMANTYYKCGQYEMALSTYNNGLGKTHQWGYRRIEACIMINIAEILRDYGRYDEAIVRYEESLELARLVMEPYYIASAKAGLGETYRRIGDLDRADVLLREVICETEERSGKDYETALFRIRLGAVERDRGNYGGAASLLSESCDKLERFGHRDGLARGYFHLAYTYLLDKDYKLSTAFLQKVSELADELGYDDFIVVEGRHAVPLVQYGAAKGIGGRRFVNAAEKVSRSEKLSNERHPASGIGSKKTGRFDLEAFALDEARVLVNSRCVKETEWRSSRAKELFFYLLLNCSGRTKEQITCAIWPDLSPAKATGNLHINIYRARRAVFPTAITTDKGRYRVNPSMSVKCDVIDFENLLKRAQSFPKGSGSWVKSLEQAIGMYRGPFLDWCYSEWAETLRRELEDKYLKALYRLAKFKGDGHEYSEAATLLEKYIAVDPYDEEAHCLLVELYLEMGDNASALRKYKQYLDRVSVELKVGPQPHLEELHKRILTASETK